MQGAVFVVDEKASSTLIKYHSLLQERSVEFTFQNHLLIWVPIAKRTDFDFMATAPFTDSRGSGEFVVDIFFYVEGEVKGVDVLVS